MYRLDCEEHIAGPECTSTSGYSGHRISVQEMQHVISCQCLAEKRDGWIPEPGDQDFELEAEHCFLTGIGKGSLHKSTLVRLEPVRHGVSKTVIENDSPIEVRSNERLASRLRVTSETDRIKAVGPRYRGTVCATHAPSVF